MIRAAYNIYIYLIYTCIYIQYCISYYYVYVERSRDVFVFFFFWLFYIYYTPLVLYFVYVQYYLVHLCP